MEKPFLISLIREHPQPKQESNLHLLFQKIENKVCKYDYVIKVELKIKTYGNMTERNSMYKINVFFIFIIQMVLHILKYIFVVHAIWKGLNKL